MSRSRVSYGAHLCRDFNQIITYKAAKSRSVVAPFLRRLRLRSSVIPLSARELLVTGYEMVQQEEPFIETNKVGLWLMMPNAGSKPTRKRQWCYPESGDPITSPHSQLECIVKLKRDQTAFQ